MMKIAIPTIGEGGLESTINPHFGKCETVTLVTVDNDEIENVNVVHPQGPHTCASIPMLFAQNNSDMCIVGGIGARPYMILQQSGIKTFTVGEELLNKSVHDVVNHFLTSGLLEIKDGTCNQQQH
ncbi:MAG: NifB/NifX family molybdenum-iron cluster-binding protein [Candidatus Heimdallarchaeota archaeon]|nr:NifB/NifX family molybdenum-iron cluster-binding protein [Candidatus Heimdallarchaeota archaeon]